MIPCGEHVILLCLPVLTRLGLSPLLRLTLGASPHGVQYAVMDHLCPALFSCVTSVVSCRFGTPPQQCVPDIACWHADRTRMVVH